MTHGDVASVDDDRPERVLGLRRGRVGSGCRRVARLFPSAQPHQLGQQLVLARLRAQPTKGLLHLLLGVSQLDGELEPAGVLGSCRHVFGELCA